MNSIHSSPWSTPSNERFAVPHPPSVPVSHSQVTVKLTFTESSPTRPTTRSNVPRPVSPLKLPVSSRVKVTSAAPARKPANSVSVVPPQSRPGISDGPSSRPSSPSKLRTQPTLHVRAQTASSQRPATPRSNPTTPHLRHRSQTSSSTDLRDRPTTAPLHHAVSHSSLHPSNLSSASSHSLIDTVAYSDDESATSVRIKAKVTHNGSSTLSPTTTSQPAFPDTRPKTHSPRVPSTSSAVSPPPLPHVFYPITTATPAANPHRYAPNKSPPQTASHHYQSFSPPTVPPLRRNGLARVDPATIPLPASSPPASTLSFSSRSSASYTTDSAATSSSQHTHPSADLQSTLAHLVQFKELNQDNHPVDTDTDPHNDNHTERKVRAEAKSNRKVRSSLTGPIYTPPTVPRLPTWKSRIAPFSP